jgi:hypothetical protein
MFALSGKFDPDALGAALTLTPSKGGVSCKGAPRQALWKSLKTEIVVILERHAGDDPRSQHG